MRRSSPAAVAGMFLRSGPGPVRAARVILGLGIVATTLVGLLAAGLLSYTTHARDVSRSREFEFTSGGEDPIANLVLRGPIWGNEQFPMIWIEPASPDAPPPPGLARWPEPGTVVISPGLNARTDLLAAYDWDVSDAGSGADGVIGDAGVLTRSELLAYARPPAGRSLGSGGALQGVRGYGTGSRDALMPIELDPDYPALGTAAYGVALFLVLPATIGLVAVSRTLSPTRRRRTEVLRRLGWRPSQIVVCNGLEALAVAIPAVVAGSLAGVALLPHLTVIPLAGWVFAPGALRPTGPAIGVVAGWVLVTVTIAATLPRRAAGRARRHTRGALLRGLGAGAAVIGTFVLVSMTMGDLASILLWAGLLMSCALWTPISRAAMWLVGTMKERRSRTVASQLVGRQVSAEAGPTAALLGPLGVVMLVCAAILAAIGNATAAGPTGPTGVETVTALSWRDSRPGDLDILASELDSDYPVIAVEDGVAVVPECADAARFVDLPIDACTAADAISDQVARAFSDATDTQVIVGVPAGGADAVVADALVRVESLADAYSVMFQHFTAPDAFTLRGAPRMRLPLIGWLAGGAVAASALLLGASLVRMADLAYGTGIGLARLERAGVPADDARRVRTRVRRTGLVTTITAASGMALLFSWSGQNAEITTVSVVSLVAVALVVGLSGWAVLALASRFGRP